MQDTRLPVELRLHLLSGTVLKLQPALIPELLNYQRDPCE
jgi:hypothetical protein